MARHVPASAAPRPQAARVPPPRPPRALPARHRARGGRGPGHCHRPVPRPARGREGARRAAQARSRCAPATTRSSPTRQLPLGPRAASSRRCGSCAAPCLCAGERGRVRGLPAARPTSLARPEARPPEMAAAFPPRGDAGRSAAGLVVAPARGRESASIRSQAGACWKRAGSPPTKRVSTPRSRLSAGTLPEDARHDWPWLAAWLASPRGRRSYLAVPAGRTASELGPMLRALLARLTP